jgi:hypothetical protein
MIPLHIDIWQNLEQIFLAGVLSGDEGEVENDRYTPHSPLIIYIYIYFYSGFTTQEKKLYARILDLIPILVPAIEGCTDKEWVFDQFVKLVRVHSCSHKCY